MPSLFNSINQEFIVKIHLACETQYLSRWEEHQPSNNPFQMKIHEMFDQRIKPYSTYSFQFKDHILNLPRLLHLALVIPMHAKFNSIPLLLIKMHTCTKFKAIVQVGKRVDFESFNLLFLHFESWFKFQSCYNLISFRKKVYPKLIRMCFTDLMLDHIVFESKILGKILKVTAISVQVIPNNNCLKSLTGPILVNHISTFDFLQIFY